MEVWFTAAVGSGVLSGVAAFILKIASKKSFSSEVFILYSAIISTVVIIPLAILIDGVDSFVWWPVLLALLGGIVAGLVGIFKIYALKFIDTTIYFPLFKLVSPFAAIIAGLMIFQERFTAIEWIGLIASLLVPLLLVNREENRRQNNLMAGLLLVLLTGILAAGVAVINKQVVDVYRSIWWIVLGASIGVLLGSLVMMRFKKIYIIDALMSYDKDLLVWATARCLTISSAFVLGLYAFFYGGSLGIVYSIQSLYILIPIALAVFFYKEHWNLQKVTAVALSMVALALLG